MNIFTPPKFIKCPKFEVGNRCAVHDFKGHAVLQGWSMQEWISVVDDCLYAKTEEEKIAILNAHVEEI